MRKLLTMLLVALSVGVLTGCSTNSPEISAPPAPVEVAPSREDAYVAAIRSNDGGALSATTDAHLIRLGNSECEHLDLGGSIEEIFQMGQEAGLDPQIAGLITGAAIRNLCPQYEAAMEVFISNNSGTIQT